MAGEFFEELSQLWEEEGLFSRDVDGQLIRLVKATEDDYLKDISITIDGEEITVKKAEPTIDSQGNVIVDQDGRTVPRNTTIFDAAQRLFVEQRGETNPIPVLCHREHMQPVAVCRLCCVEVCRTNRDGKIVPGGKLVPACHQPVTPGMIVHTIHSPDEARSQRVKKSVNTLTELLAGDHVAHGNGNESEIDLTNELATLAKQIQCDPNRFVFRERQSRGQDQSSVLISVNHDSCILCERCIRGCNEIKENMVMGRTGKGYSARIGFDLDTSMKESTCVSCGECMVSCPTDALTFRKPVQSQWHSQLVSQSGYSAVTASELKQHKLFRGVSLKWLQWNQASVVKRQVKKGDVLAWLGDYDTTAFILNRGEFALWFREPAIDRTQSVAARGLINKLTRRIRGRAHVRSDIPQPDRRVPTSEPDAISTPQDMILGEMTCLSFYPRNGTVVAWSDGEVYEIRRNVLYMLQRNAVARKELDKVYRERALFSQMRSVDLFTQLRPEERGRCLDFLRDKVQLITVEPGQIIFRQGEPADHFYMIRLGYVKISQTRGDREQILTYLGPNGYFGEIGLLSATDDLQHLEMPQARDGKRTSTCTALDDVELVRIRGDDFRQIMSEFEGLRTQFKTLSTKRLITDESQADLDSGPLREFLDQRLFNAQKLLVLDLDSCTRCDECVKACADTHQGVTRLVREGLRFDKYLVASACRSCQDPYCMVGCPVDSIHRKGSLEIVIDDHCIGCGLCAKNCPYGNINMVGEAPIEYHDESTGRVMPVIQQKATTCDLCKSVGVDATHPKDEVSCVYACPHNAAFRLDGAELWRRIQQK